MTAALAYVAAVLLIVAVGVTAIGDLRSAAAKQKRELDASIDQIVEQHKERKALVAKADTSGAGEPRLAAAQTTGSGKTGEPAKAAHPAARKSTLALEENYPEAKSAEVRSPAEVKSPKKQRQVRTGSSRQHFLPSGFASLPKFTAYSLLGLHD